MADKFEQLACVNLGRSATRNLGMLSQAFDKYCSDQTQVLSQINFGRLVDTGLR